MDKVLLDVEEVISIAEAIRDKTGDNFTMKISQMPEKIMSIATKEEVEPKNIEIEIYDAGNSSSKDFTYASYNSDGSLSYKYGELGLGRSDIIIVAANSLIHFHISSMYGDYENPQYSNVIPKLTQQNHYVFETTDVNGRIGMNYIECCFIPGTQILIDLEGNTKPIEEIKAGDSIVSYNVETGENYITTVARLTVNKSSRKMADVSLSNGISLSMTEYHPLYCKDGWKSLTGHKGYDILEIGDEVKTIDGYAFVDNINQYTLDEPICTYTIDVRDKNENPDNDTNDNFYANGAVAHNASCPM